MTISKKLLSIRTLFNVVLICLTFNLSVFSEKNSNISNIKFESSDESSTRRRRNSGLEDLSRFKLSIIKNKIQYYRNEQEKTNFQLISSNKSENEYIADLEIVSIKSKPEIKPAGRSRHALTKETKIHFYDKIFMSDGRFDSLKFSIPDFVTFTVYKKSSFLIKKLDKKNLVIEILLVTGKMNLLVHEGYVNVETLNSSIEIPKGKIDVMISGMNTLVAPRESNVWITSSNGDRIAKVGQYTLVTSKGAMITSALKSDKKKKGDDVFPNVRQKGKKSFLKRKPE